MKRSQQSRQVSCNLYNSPPFHPQDEETLWIVFQKKTDPTNRYHASEIQRSNIHHAFTLHPQISMAM